MKLIRFFGVATICFGLATAASAANVLIVGGGVGGETELELKTKLESLGHIVSRPIATYTAAPPTAGELSLVDLVLVSRSVNSGDYTQGTEAVQWNSMNKPLILMSPQTARGGTAAAANNRWGWFNNNTVTDNQPAPTDFDSPFPNPAHPFVAGRTTSVFPAGVTADTLTATAAQIPAGATVVATLTSGTITNFLGLVDIPAGTQLFADTNGTQTTTTARRAFFHMWEYPDVANRAFELSANGDLILDQIIDTLAPTTTQPGDANLDGHANLTDYGLIRDNFQKTGQTRAMGDLNADGNVNFLDFRIWTQYRTDGFAGSTFGIDGFIPEPGSATLLAGSLSIILAAGRRRARTLRGKSF